MRAVRPIGLTLKTLLCCAFLIVVACGGNGKNSGQTEIVIYAASSTTDLISEAAAEFTKQTGIEVGFEFASSGSLARKIESGSPTDIFVSANQRWIEYSYKQGLLDSTETKLFARNTLVFVEPTGHPSGIKSPEQLLEAQRISIGESEHVPAGRYAKQALEHFGLWDRLMQEEKLVVAINVRSALGHVEQGDVTGGIVYSTDAVRSKKVRTAFTIPPESHKPITYHAGVVSTSGLKREAGQFLDFLSGDTFLYILERHGFKRP